MGRVSQTREEDRPWVQWPHDVTSSVSRDDVTLQTAGWRHPGTNVLASWLRWLYTTWGWGGGWGWGWRLWPKDTCISYFYLKSVLNFYKRNLNFQTEHIKEQFLLRQNTRQLPKPEAFTWRHAISGNVACGKVKVQCLWRGDLCTLWDFP